MHCKRGFTLVETMIAVAVVGILAAVSYPSYQDQVRKSRRSEVQALMMEMSARQHQRLLDVRSYRAGSPADLGVDMSDEMGRFYSVVATADNSAMPPSFTITATPSTEQGTDRCGTLLLTHTGRRIAMVGNAEVSGCW